MEVLNCPNCTGTIEVQANDAFGTCHFCGTKVAVAEYTKLEENDATRGDALFDLGEYDKAEVAYTSAVMSAPGDYRTWRGMMRIALRKNDNDAVKYAANALKLAPAPAQQAIREELQAVIDEFAVSKRYLEEKYGAKGERLPNANMSVYPTKEEMQEVKAQAKLLYNEKKTKAPLVLLIVGLVLLPTPLWFVGLVVLVAALIVRNGNKSSAKQVVLVEWVKQRQAYLADAKTENIVAKTRMAQVQGREGLLQKLAKECGL